MRTGHVELEPTEQFAVQQTLARYAFALDQNDPVALTDVLTEDATWTFAITGQPGPGPIAGRPAILAFVRGAMDAHTDQRRHNLVNIVLDRADAGTAVVRAYLLLMSNAGETPSVVTTGFYTFTLHRAENEWRIATLFLDMDG
jgi:ketosteroid isomerase-like protein